MRGLVVDPDGRVVPKATVSLTNPGTNQRQTVNTDGAGAFLFSQVPPSTYVHRRRHRCLFALAAVSADTVADAAIRGR